jgi:hypothetical protein
MMNSGWKIRFTRAATAGLLGLAIAAAAGTAVRANDDEKSDEAFDTKIIRQFLHGLGLRSSDGTGIEYRERSPLVVPPARDLPPPETGSIVDKTAAWPNDPDVKRAKQAKADRKKPARTVEDEWNPELPSQLGPRAKSAPPGQVPTAGPYKDPTAPSTMSELNAKSIFTLGGLIGSKNESATFTGEPPRASLTEPPVGYRTPSPTHMYGVGKSKDGGVTALDPMDHASSNSPAR